MYELKNPLGDPFSFTEPKTLEGGILFGLGLGLYWGEGQKRGKSGLRLSNSDPKLIRKFIDFLEKSFAIDRGRLRISIQNGTTILQFNNVKLKQRICDLIENIH